MAVKAIEAMITPTTTPIAAHSQPGVPSGSPFRGCRARLKNWLGWTRSLELEVELVLEDELVPGNELVLDEVLDELEVVVVCWVVVVVC